MRYLRWMLIMATIVFEPLQAQPYAEILDKIIHEKTHALTAVFPHIKNLVGAMKANIKKSSLQDIDDFFEHGNHLLLAQFKNQIQRNAEEFFLENAPEVEQALADLRFAVTAKLYMHYLECSKQKMLYIAVKIYDALQYWKHEQFEESRYFYQKNILRWFFRSEYQYKITYNIELLEKNAKDVYGFLGLIKYNQRCLQQARNEDEFQQSLQLAVKLQDKFFDDMHPDDESDITENLLKHSVDQIILFCDKILSQYAQAQLPCHVERHFQSYVMLAAVLCASGFIATTYQQQITQGTQYFWEHHVRKPVEQFRDMFAGLTNIPKIDPIIFEEDKKLLEELIEVGAKIPQVNGDLVPLHQANAEFLHDATGGQLKKQYEQIKELIDRAEGILDDGQQQRKNLQKLWSELVHHYANFEQKLADGTLKVEGAGISTYNPLLYLFGEAESKNINEGVDAIRPIKDFIADIKKSLEQSAFLAQSPEVSDHQVPSITNSIPIEIKQGIDEIMSVEYQSALPVDTSGWSFEQKKQKAFENDCVILANPEKNIKNLVGAYHRMLLRSLVDIKEQPNKFIHETNYLIEEVYTDNRFVLGLVAFIPVATVCGGSLFASNKIYNFVVYKPIRKFMNHIEVLLNESFYEIASFEKEGYLYFLTEQLKLHVTSLTVEEQRLMEEDIASLQSTKLDYVQKFNIVQRMYRTYPCLAPGAIY